MCIHANVCADVRLYIHEMWARGREPGESTVNEQLCSETNSGVFCEICHLSNVLQQMQVSNVLCGVQWHDSPQVVLVPNSVHARAVLSVRAGKSYPPGTMLPCLRGYIILMVMADQYAPNPTVKLTHGCLFLHAPLHLRFFFLIQTRRCLSWTSQRALHA